VILVAEGVAGREHHAVFAGEAVGQRARRDVEAVAHQGEEPARGGVQATISACSANHLSGGRQIRRDDPTSPRDDLVAVSKGQEGQRRSACRG
jgi:hypothetical protein